MSKRREIGRNYTLPCVQCNSLAHNKNLSFEYLQANGVALCMESGVEQRDHLTECRYNIDNRRQLPSFIRKFWPL